MPGTPLPPPAPPFDDWPIQLADGRFGYVWYAAPSVLINQVHVPHATVEAVDALHDAFDRVIAVERADYERRGGLLFIHDWRRIDGYERPARQVYLSRMRRRTPGYVRKAVAVLPGTPLLKMAVQTANVLMALRIGGSFALASDPSEVLSEHGVERPTRVGWYE